MNLLKFKECLDYDPETGLFIRKKASGKSKIGDIAGTIVKGYVSIMVDYEKISAHRLAFYFMEGRLPASQIDHINHIRDDNRWKNLRHATDAINSKNKSMLSNNKSGVMGVYWHKQNNKWASEIKLNRIKKHLGSYTYFIIACAVRKEAEIEYGFHPNHGIGFS